MPTTTQGITESLIRENVTRAIGDVFKTMLGRSATLAASASQSATAGWPPLPRKDSEPVVPQVVGTVGFLGEANGLIYLYLPLTFAQMVTRQLLGMTQAEIERAGDEVINDAIGEITNMCVGSFKNGLCDAGFPCMLTIPSILRGTNFCIEPIRDVQRYIYSFECNGHKFVTDILLKNTD